LKPGINARQCAARGIEILEQSIRTNEWVDQSVIYVTVDPTSEAQFKDSVSHFRVKQCLTGMPEGTYVPHDNIKAVWLVEECSYILIDGHHRVLALRNLHDQRVQGLPEKVRLVLMCSFPISPMGCVEMLISLYLVVPQVPYPSKPLPLGQVCVV
jgi:hypothetical protein